MSSHSAQATDTQTSGVLGLFRLHATYAALALVFLTLSRVALLFWLQGRWDLASDALRVLGYGVRMDLIAVCYTLAPAVLLTLIAGGRGPVGAIVAGALRGYFAVVLTLFVMLELSTPAFVAEYDMRPNRLFIEYLVHPEEVSSMLLKGHLGVLLAVNLLTAIAAVAIVRVLSRVRSVSGRVPALSRIAAFLVLGPALFLGARSSLQHRPANPSSVAMWNDHLVNDLCLSSLYSVAYAAQHIKDEADAGDVYGKLDSCDVVVDQVRAAMQTVDPLDFVSAEYPTLHRHDATFPRDKPHNLVIILEESLGAQYIEELGGKPITQFIGTLKGESWWFENLYATGTRSVRGIEAVIAGFLPTPARSVVKLGLSQTKFFTLASLLGDKGFRTQFFYGGEAHFDNMRRFFTGNGFQEICDRSTIENPTFVGSWGACDQDIFNKAHASFEEQTAKSDQPFFSVIFSVSNHSPFDYPGGFIDLIEPEPASPMNAVRYADFALGEFIGKARASSYWNDTVFLIVADHDARVHGASLVPIEHFHIPAIILGADVEPRIDTRLASQFDLPTTLLSLIGISSVHPMIGSDLTKLADDAPGRAILQYGPNQAYLTQDQALILRPHQPAKQFTRSGSQLEPVAVDPALRRKALAHALLPSYLYRERIYCVPELTPESPSVEVSPSVASTPP